MAEEFVKTGHMDGMGESIARKLPRTPPNRDIKA